jgi:acyl carrier protein
MPSEIDVLSDYIRTEMAYNGPLDPTMDLLEEKVLDSFSIVQMAVFIQDKFEVELDANDLVRENLSTLSRMVELINKRRTA